MARRKSHRRKSHRRALAHRVVFHGPMGDPPSTNWMIPIAVGATAVATALMFLLQKRKVATAAAEVDRLVAAASSVVTEE